MKFVVGNTQSANNYIPSAHLSYQDQMRLAMRYENVKFALLNFYPMALCEIYHIADQVSIW